MAGKLGRSGPPGNVNGLIHGGASRVLAVPAGKGWIASLVRQHRRRLVEELGGESELTEAKRGFLMAGLVAWQKALLLSAYLAEHGEHDEEGKVRESLTNLPRFLKLYQDTLREIGLERRAVDENDLHAIMRREPWAKEVAE